MENLHRTPFDLFVQRLLSSDSCPPPPNAPAACLASSTCLVASAAPWKPAPLICCVFVDVSSRSTTAPTSTSLRAIGRHSHWPATWRALPRLKRASDLTRTPRSLATPWQDSSDISATLSLPSWYARSADMHFQPPNLRPGTDTPLLHLLVLLGAVRAMAHDQVQPQREPEARRVGNCTPGPATRRGPGQRIAHRYLQDNAQHQRQRASTCDRFR